MALRKQMVADALVESPDIDRYRPPAIVLMTAEDVRDPDAELRALLRTALPGRPILLGGSGDRAVLTDAINELGVFRVLPKDVDPSVIIGAINDAHEDVELRASLEILASSLREEAEKVAAAIHDLRRTQSDLLHTERLSTIGRLTGGLVRAVDNHQQVVQGFASVLVDTDLELHRLANAAVDGTLSVGALLEDIQAYASGQERTFSKVVEDLDTVVKGAVSFARFDELSTDRTLMIDPDSGAQVELDRYAIYQVIVNLVRNALQATKPGGVVEVRTFCDQDEAVIEVEDNGTGMTSEVRTRMFDPFFTTRGDSGLGLGLRAVRSIVRQHGGTVKVRSREGRGTRIQARLPRVS